MTTETRLCKNWLSTLGAYVEDTESPRHFWLWSGLFTIGSALQRKVWLPFGMETIFPNLFIMFVAPPGWSRKGAPVGFSKRILEDIGIPVGIDSPTKRHMTKKLAALSESEGFVYKGRNRSQAPLALVSKELSSFLSVDPKSMIDALTDLYDCHDKWDYGTSGKGEDFIRNLFVSCLFATTPDWVAQNLPDFAIGGGFTSRFILCSGFDRYKDVPRPPIPNPEIYIKLKRDLDVISRLVGEFNFTDEAGLFFDNWYLTIKAWADSIGDDRLYSNFSRVHVMAIKAAMCLHVARRDDLTIELQDIKKGIYLIQTVFGTASEAFSSHGRSPLAITLDKIIKQVRVFGLVTTNRLLKINYRDVTKTSLLEILDNLETMKLVKSEYDMKTNTTFIKWIGGGKKKNVERGGKKGDLGNAEREDKD